MQSVSSFMPIYRTSGRLMQEMDEAYRRGWGGHMELTFATIATVRGLRVTDMGGHGEFTPDTYRGRVYTGTARDVFHTPGTLVFKPTFFRTGSRPDMLWHPVKPFWPAQELRSELRAFRKAIGVVFAGADPLAPAGPLARAGLLHRATRHAHILNERHAGLRSLLATARRLASNDHQLRQPSVSSVDRFAGDVIERDSDAFQSTCRGPGPRMAPGAARGLPGWARSATRRQSCGQARWDAADRTPGGERREGGFPVRL